MNRPRSILIINHVIIHLKSLNHLKHFCKFISNYCKNGHRKDLFYTYFFNSLNVSYYVRSKCSDTNCIVQSLQSIIGHSIIMTLKITDTMLMQFWIMYTVFVRIIFEHTVQRDCKLNCLIIEYVFVHNICQLRKVFFSSGRESGKNDCFIKNE